MRRSEPDANAEQLPRTNQLQIELAERLRRESSSAESFDWQAADYTIPRRFAEMVAAHPDRPAARDLETTYTYRELDEASNRVANALLSRRGPGSEIVALLVGRGTPSVIAALGALKTGKAYVALDHEMFADRAVAILSDSESSLLLTDSPGSDLARQLVGQVEDVIQLDDALRSAAQAPQVSFAPGDLALLAYSSGTTGRPKGIVQTHYTALAHAASLADLECYGVDDRLSTFSGLTSGSNFLKVFAALCVGACVAIYDVRRYGIDRLLDWLEETEITACGSRAMFRQLYPIAGGRQLPKVRTFTLGGDTIYRRDIIETRQLFPNGLASVGLGMTEASRITRWLVDPSLPLEEEVVPAGFPAPWVRIVILNEAGEEVEPGETGEVAVLSDFLAKGYWKQPELTAERFQHVPRYGSTPLYKTGDMGWLGADGMLRHLGRKDYQVKIRGYLVPTNDVEGVLLMQPGISEACVVKVTMGADRSTLVAYVSTDDSHPHTTEALQAALAARLPDYMVPQRIIFMDALPRNARGKVDRSLLPPPTSDRPALQVAYVAPASPLEERVVALWSEILGIDDVGMDDEFLALGGDSLQAMRLVNQINDLFQIDLAPSLLLKAATAADMVALLRTHLFDTFAELSDLDSLGQTG